MSVSNNSDGIAPLRLTEAFELARPEMLLLKESQLLPVNLQPIAAVSIVRGALPGLLAMRSTIEEEFRKFDATVLDRIERYAFALTHAQAVYQSVTKRSKTLSKLSKDAVRLRERFLQDLQALVQRGQVDKSRLSKLKGAHGHRNIASDLLILMTVLRECWPDIVGKTAVTRDELEQAELLCNQLVAAIGMRQQVPTLAVDAAADRQRAFTLFMRAYDQIRRAVVFLRWETGDIDSIAPSLYAKSHNSRKGRPEPTPNEQKPAAESTVCNTTGEAHPSNLPAQERVENPERTELGEDPHIAANARARNRKHT
ncbi:MAG TPA: hypothetical protein VIV60_08260 [Polyangiaceae bacterium]